MNKIALSSNDDKRMQSFDSIKTYAYGRSKDPQPDVDKIYLYAKDPDEAR